jgi:O-antigen/teichoic acid export membrane protein
MPEIIKLALPLLPLSVAQQFGRLIITVLLARWMTPEHYGAFATVYVLIEILIQPASLGFGQSMVRFGARYFRGADYALLRGLRRFSLLAVTVAGTALTFVLMRGAVPLVEGSATHEGLLYVLIGAPVGALVQAQAGYLLSTKRLRQSMLSKQVLPEWCAIGAGAVIFVLADSIGVHEALWAICLGFAITFIVQSAMTYRDAVWSRSPRYRVGEWIHTSIPLMLTASGTALVTRLDVMLVRLVEDERAVALFFPAVVIAGLTMVPANAINAVCKPLLSRDGADVQGAAFRCDVSRMARALMFANTLTVALLALAGWWLLALYGERHPHEVMSVLLIMLAGRLLLPFRIVSNGLLKLAGNPWYSAVAFVSGSVIAIAAALALHARYGLAGLALGFTLGFAVGIALRLLFVRRTLGVPLAILCGLDRGTADS